MIGKTKKAVNAMLRSFSILSVFATLTTVAQYTHDSYTIGTCGVVACFVVGFSEAIIRKLRDE